MNGKQVSQQLVKFTLPPTLKFKQLLDNFLGLLTVTDTTFAEFWSSTAFILIGFILAIPVKSLDGNIPLFKKMLSVVPESPGWSFLFLAVGVGQAAANLFRVFAPLWMVDGKRESIIKYRRYAAFVASVFAGFLGILGVLSSAPVLILGALFLTHSFVQGLVYLRLGVKPK